MFKEVTEATGKSQIVVGEQVSQVPCRRANVFLGFSRFQEAKSTIRIITFMKLHHGVEP